MRNVEALCNGLVSVAVLAHPLGFGLVALCDVKKKDAREEKDDQQHSKCGGHGLDWSNGVNVMWSVRCAQCGPDQGQWVGSCCNA